MALGQDHKLNNMLITEGGCLIFQKKITEVEVALVKLGTSSFFLLVGKKSGMGHTAPAPIDSIMKIK